jgi:uncharacterized protein with PIN domain
VAAKLVADENFKGAIVRGLRRQQPSLDVVRIQDVGLDGSDDPDILEWAAQEQRILLTHDVKTVTKYAYQRLAVGLPMPGVIEAKQDAPIAQVIEDILLLTEFEDELKSQIRYVPLK